MRRNRGRITPLAALALGVVTAVTLGLGVTPAAMGDPGGAAGGGAVPSQAQVDRARARAADTARDVGAIKAELILADQRLQQAAVEAEQASEAYNGAMWQLEQAKTAYGTARRDAARARRTVAGQRDRMGALVAQSYQQGGDLVPLGAMMSSDGVEGVLDQYAGMQGASSSLQADYKRYAASDALAQVFEDRARAAKAEQSRLAARAAESRDLAVAAAESAQAQATAIRVEKDRLIVELARAQHISVGLARTRQAALEEIARRRAVERARQEAVAAARAEAAAAAALAARDAAAAEAAARQRAAAARTARVAPSPTRPASRPAARTRAPRATVPSAPPAPRPPAPRAPAPRPPAPRAPAPPPPPAPRPPAPRPPTPSGGASQAIAFAKAQLGEPYQWGATGPGSWDCSGLTMGAWASAGTYLPHYSVAQYDAGTRISVSQLRPGDLVFWSSNGSPSGIHHVAMYIGNGQIIHAPRTGRPVEIDDMYYWIPPDFFVRV